MKWLSLLLCGSLLFAGSAFGQNIQPYVSEMNKALGEHGSVSGSAAPLDGHVLKFTFAIPGPRFAFVSKDTGDPETTKWTVMRLDFMSITADLRLLDEGKIDELMVFSAPYIGAYKPGDVGDTTIVEFHTIAGALLSRTTIDREMVSKLKFPGTYTEEQLGAKTITETVGLIAFSDKLAARDFEKALRVAIVIAKAE